MMSPPIAPTPALAECIARLAPLHRQLCPRQVLGVRIGLYAGEILGLDLPQTDKQLLTFVETDGCFADGIAAATGCSIGHRTLRVVDYGKVAAVFVDTETPWALRVWPHPRARERTGFYARAALSRWQTQLEAYCVMPSQELMQAERVALAEPAETVVSQPGLRVSCVRCGEEIMNGREVVLQGKAFCRGCVGKRYYESLGGT
jgi:formylmethanofuran dehydrogenase subunit E